MSEIPRIEINLDKKCKQCGKPGACQNGLCLSCNTGIAAKTMPKTKPKPTTGHKNKWPNEQFGYE